MSRLRTVGLTTAVVVLAAGGALGGFGVSAAVRGDSSSTLDAGRRPAVLGSATASPSSPALSTGASSSTAAAPSATAVARALAPYARASGLGRQLRARVVDVASGGVLYDQDGTTPAAPASTTKILTAAAVLTVHAPSDRITTAVRDAGNGTVVLVGAGDPTLSGARGAQRPAYAGAARLTELARQVRAAGVTVRRVVVDDSAFTGPSVSPAWAAEDVPSEYGAAITAVMADGGRASPSAETRSASPDLDAGREFAAALGAPSAPVTRGTAGGTVVARVQSATYAQLVEQMLVESDDVIADCLARRVAIAEHGTASFTGAAAAVRTTIRRLGVDPGDGLLDSSGLAAADRVPPSAIAAVLRLAAGSSRPALHVLVAGLPVAAWSGTLNDRYLSGLAHAAAGVVRAKTGTLTGVSALAGLVHDRSGRLLAFDIVADRAASTPAAQAALDTLVGRLSACGCT